MDVTRLETVISPSQKRVLIRPFLPSSPRRTRNILERIDALSEEKVRALIDPLLQDMATRHLHPESLLLSNFQLIKDYLHDVSSLSENRKLLIGAYFTQEYALESTALFNPSIVVHPDQSGLHHGELRFILSLRAIGEGHISSIVFREGVITRDFKVIIDEPTPFVMEPVKTPNPSFDKTLFARKLDEMGSSNEHSEQILRHLPEQFKLANLLDAVDEYERGTDERQNITPTLDSIRLLAYSNYEVTFAGDQKMSEKVIFPSSPSESNGIEDARFVLFFDEDGSARYVSTYTAYDGMSILPQLLETPDFTHFSFCTLNGPAVKNKGMALFPRRIGGLYAMLSRQDNENIFLMYSDNLHFWYEPVRIIEPAFPWEYVQLGNCGSPLEIDEGWLVLSHGVGPMRKYCLAAFLLDKREPTRLLARMKEPLLQPEEHERIGYVPNVLYSCGALVFHGKLILPYAMSDYATTFAVADISDILDSME